MFAEIEEILVHEIRSNHKKWNPKHMIDGNFGVPGLEAPQSVNRGIHT